jgi:hypothetical protein
LVDPSGEAIELPGDPDKRKKALEALCMQVGPEACKRLYDNVDPNTGIHYVGISGDHTAFGQINAAAGDLAAVVDRPEIVALSVVPAGTRITDDLGHSVTIGSREQGMEPGATGRMNGKTTITILDPDSYYGTLAANVMSNGKDSPVDAGIVVAHEEGHAAERENMFLQPAEPPEAVRDLNLRNTNRMSVEFENDVRKTRDPSGPTRSKETNRDPNQPQN